MLSHHSAIASYLSDGVLSTVLDNARLACLRLGQCLRPYRYVFQLSAASSRTVHVGYAHAMLSLFQHFYYSQMLGVQMRVAYAGLIYRKVRVERASARVSRSNMFA